MVAMIRECLARGKMFFALAILDQKPRWLAPLIYFPKQGYFYMNQVRKIFGINQKSFRDMIEMNQLADIVRLSRKRSIYIPNQRWREISSAVELCIEQEILNRCRVSDNTQMIAEILEEKGLPPYTGNTASRKCIESMFSDKKGSEIAKIFRSADEMLDMLGAEKIMIWRNDEILYFKAMTSEKERS